MNVFSLWYNLFYKNIKQKLSQELYNVTLTLLFVKNC